MPWVSVSAALCCLLFLNCWTASNSPLPSDQRPCVTEKPDVTAISWTIRSYINTERVSFGPCSNKVILCVRALGDKPGPGEEKYASVDS
jgi:hypothetical protein